MASGMPGEDGVISGMKLIANYIHIDIENAINDGGLDFYKSSTMLY